MGALGAAVFQHIIYDTLHYLAIREIIICNFIKGLKIVLVYRTSGDVGVGLYCAGERMYTVSYQLVPIC